MTFEPNAGGDSGVKLSNIFLWKFSVAEKHDLSFDVESSLNRGIDKLLRRINTYNVVESVIVKQLPH